MKLLHLKQMLLVVTCFAVVAMVLVAPIPQDSTYHHFTDQRQMAFLPNFWNAVSNLGFLDVGVCAGAVFARVAVVAHVGVMCSVHLLGMGSC